MENSNAQVRPRQTRHEFVSAQQAIYTTSPRLLNREHPNDVALLKIACDAAWLLNQRSLVVGLEFFQHRYQRLLVERELATSSGRVYTSKLLIAFKDYYSSAVLNFLHCEVNEHSQHNWLFRLVRSPKSAQHPLHHLLLLQLLGHTAETFFVLPTEFQCISSPSTKEIKPPTDQKALKIKRMAWSSLFEENPTAGTKLLRSILPSVYTWLYRHDREWLKANMPPPHHGISPPRVDWKRRDLLLSEAAKREAIDLKNAASAPIQVTVSAVGRAIGQLPIIQKHLDRLPLTAQVLADVVETREEFAIRRVRWATECFRIENVYPQRWQLVRRASLRAELATLPTVAQAITEAMLALNPLA